MNKYYKKLMLFSIKYGPVLLSTTCSFKIFILGNIKYINSPSITIIHWINLVLNILFLGIIYFAGKTLGYCWKHRSLCRTALWGYIYYTFFLLFNVPQEVTSFISIYYIILNICIIIYYKY